MRAQWSQNREIVGYRRFFANEYVYVDFFRNCPIGISLLNYDDMHIFMISSFCRDELRISCAVVFFSFDLMFSFRSVELLNKKKEF